MTIIPTTTNQTTETTSTPSNGSGNAPETTKPTTPLWHEKMPDYELTDMGVQFQWSMHRQLWYPISPLSNANIVGWQSKADPKVRVMHNPHMQDREEPVEQPEQIQSMWSGSQEKGYSRTASSRPTLAVPAAPRDLVAVRFSPAAWWKLRQLKHMGRTEIGAFALTSLDDLLFVRDVKLTPQQCTGASVEFDNDGIAQYVADMVAAGHHPAEFFRIWIHTHPTFGPTPSAVDETTFRKIFGEMDWAVMLVVGKDEECYARLQFNAVPEQFRGMCSRKLRVEVDWNASCEAVDGEALIDEYVHCVREGWGGATYVQTSVGYASVQPASYYTRQYGSRGSYWENPSGTDGGFLPEDNATLAPEVQEAAAILSAPQTKKRDHVLEDATEALACREDEERRSKKKRIESMSDKEWGLYSEGYYDGFYDSRHYDDDLALADDPAGGFLQEAEEARKESEKADAQIRMNANAETARDWAAID